MSWYLQKVVPGENDRYERLHGSRANTNGGGSLWRGALLSALPYYFTDSDSVGGGLDLITRFGAA